MHHNSFAPAQSSFVEADDSTKQALDAFGVVSYSANKLVWNFTCAKENFSDARVCVCVCVCVCTRGSFSRQLNFSAFVFP